MYVHERTSKKQFVKNKTQERCRAHLARMKRQNSGFFFLLEKVTVKTKKNLLGAGGAKFDLDY